MHIAREASPQSRVQVRPSLRILLVLLVSILVRLLLAAQGGQLFYGDEPRFFRGTLLYHYLLEGNVHAVAPLLRAPEHTGFVYVTALLAPFQHALAQFTPFGDWSQSANIWATAWLGAALLGLFSTLDLWLIYRLALAAGATQREALWAAFLATAANSLFYYSRHLLPYDAALSAALAGLLFTISGSNRSRLFLGGAGAGLSFQIYNGYWFLVPITGLALWLSLPDWRTRLRATVPWVVGCLAAMLLVVLPATLCGGLAYWRDLTAFSGTVLQGVFAEGWSLPWAYLWHTEGIFGLLTAGAIVAALVLDKRAGSIPARFKLWLILALATYALFILVSNGLEKFVIYGRTVRTLVPLFCLAGGYALDRLLPERLIWRGLAGVTIILCAIVNFLPVFALVYSDDVIAHVTPTFGQPKRALSYSGCFYFPLTRPVNRPDLALVNAQLIYPLRDYLGYPAGTVLLSVHHPLGYVPYQFDGLTPRERRLLSEHPPMIQLIKLANPGATPDEPPLAQICQPAELADGRDHGRN